MRILKVYELLTQNLTLTIDEYNKKLDAKLALASYSISMPSWVITCENVEYAKNRPNWNI